MQALRLILALGLCVPALEPLWAQTIAPQEREFLLDQLQKSRRVFLDSLAGLSEAQLKFKPGPDRWSVAECAEHVAVTEDFLFDLVTEKILKAPVNPQLKSSGREGDQQLLKMVVDRSKKATAPEPVRPTGRFADLAAVIDHFNASRDRTISFARATREDLRAHVSTGGPGGPMDAYQFLLLMAGHAERHTLQIEEVKAHQNFPKF